MSDYDLLYHELRAFFISEGLKVNPYRELSNPEGIQFIVFDKDTSVILRCFMHDTLSIEASAEAPSELKQKVGKLTARFLKIQEDKKIKPVSTMDPIFPLPPTEDPDTLIGLGFFGANAPFGPLVVAAVCLSSKSHGEQVFHLPNDDEKMAFIQTHYPLALISIPPRDYNSVLEKFPNPKQVLAWAQYRTLDAVMKQTPCNTVLASEFGSLLSLQTSFLSRGKKPVLYTRPGRSQHLAVTLAEFVAHYRYRQDLKRVSEELEMILPEGPQSEANIQAVLKEVSVNPASLVKKL